MTTVYTRTIHALLCLPDSDTVCEVHWLLTATDGEFAARIGRRTTIEYDPITPFIAYEALTPLQVMEWLQAKIPESEFLASQEIIDKSLADQRLGLSTPMTVSLTSPTPPETAENGVIWRIVSTNLE